MGRYDFIRFARTVATMRAAVAAHPDPAVRAAAVEAVDAAAELAADELGAAYPKRFSRERFLGWSRDADAFKREQPHRQERP